MADRATPNLPSRDLDVTAGFYAAIGFVTTYSDPGWLILQRGSVVLEFFHHPRVNPAKTSASASLRVDDLDGWYVACVAAGLPEARRGCPRVHPPAVEDSGLRIAYLIDPDGSLLRLIQN